MILKKNLDKTIAEKNVEYIIKNWDNPLAKHGYDKIEKDNSTLIPPYVEEHNPYASNDPNVSLGRVAFWKKKGLDGIVIIQYDKYHRVDYNDPVSINWIEEQIIAYDESQATSSNKSWQIYKDIEIFAVGKAFNYFRKEGLHSAFWEGPNNVEEIDLNGKKYDVLMLNPQEFFAEVYIPSETAKRRAKNEKSKGKQKMKKLKLIEVDRYSEGEAGIAYELMKDYARLARQANAEGWSEVMVINMMPFDDTDGSGLHPNRPGLDALLQVSGPSGKVYKALCTVNESAHENEPDGMF